MSTRARTHTNIYTVYKNQNAHNANIQHQKLTKIMIHNNLNSDDRFQICLSQASFHTFEDIILGFKLDYKKPPQQDNMLSQNLIHFIHETKVSHADNI
jgi:hypothetical protein